MSHENYHHLQQNLEIATETGVTGPDRDSASQPNKFLLNFETPETYQISQNYDNVQMFTFIFKIESFRCIRLFTSSHLLVRYGSIMYVQEFTKKKKKTPYPNVKELKGIATSKTEALQNDGIIAKNIVPPELIEEESRLALEAGIDFEILRKQTVIKYGRVRKKKT